MKNMKRFAALMLLLCAMMICTVPALAAGENDGDVSADTVTVTAGSNENDVTSAKALGSGVMIGLACLGGAMMGLVFIETVIIYALIVAILIIFVL